MSHGSGQSDIDRVRDATDLLALVGEHVALKARGREHVAICPFHEDHTPSLAVVTHKGNAFYKCHACGASGDAFTFVMEYHRKDFAEALRFLADRAGITLEGRSGAPRKGDTPDRGELRKANADAAEFFQRALADPALGKMGRDVIERRGITDEMAKQFKVGIAPQGFTALLSSFRGDRRAEQAAAAAGLLKERSDKSHYDAFRHRLIFPICDELGHPIAFGGRRLDDEDEPKYLNSSESPVFQKSRTLYGLNLARRAIIESKRVIVVEGYTDVIACHQAGLINVVGTLGTALTPEHARLLSRLCDTVVLVFDGDEAGQRAADRGVQVFFDAPVDIRICVLPDQLDPDDLLRRDDGVERFGTAVDEAVDALGFKVQRFSDQLGAVDTLAGREKHMTGFLAELADLGFNAMPGVRKRWVLARLAELLDVSIPDIEQAMPRGRRRPATPAPPGHAPPATGPTAQPALDLGGGGGGTIISRARRMAERDLLSILVFRPESAATAVSLDDGDRAPITDQFGLDDFRDPTCRAIAECALGRIATAGSFSVPQLLEGLDDPRHREVASALYFEGARRCGEDAEHADEAIAEAAAALHHCRQDERYRRQVATAAPSRVSPDRQVEALDALLSERRERGDMATAITRGVRS